MRGGVMDVNLVGAGVALGFTACAAWMWIVVIRQLRSGTDETETNRAETNSSLS